MRRLSTLTTILPMAMVLLLGCQKKGVKGILVEQASPIVNTKGVMVQSLGVESLGGVFTPVIPSGSKTPIQVSELFSTAVDNQEQITVRLFRGNAKLAKDNTPLGVYQVTGIDPAPRGTPQIEITFAIEGSDIRLSAKNPETDNEVAISKKSLR